MKIVMPWMDENSVISLARFRAIATSKEDRFDYVHDFLKNENALLIDEYELHPRIKRKIYHLNLNLSNSLIAADFVTARITDTYEVSHIAALKNHSYLQSYSDIFKDEIFDTSKIKIEPWNLYEKYLFLTLCGSNNGFVHLHEKMKSQLTRLEEIIKND